MHPFKKMILSLATQINASAVGYCYSLTIANSVNTTNIGVRYSSPSSDFYTYSSFASSIGYTDGANNITYYLCSLSNPAIVHMDTLEPFIWSEGSFVSSGSTCAENGECVIP